jgi:hypothetical protein
MLALPLMFHPDLPLVSRTQPPSRVFEVYSLLPAQAQSRFSARLVALGMIP